MVDETQKWLDHIDSYVDEYGIDPIDGRRLLEIAHKALAVVEAAVQLKDARHKDYGEGLSAEAIIHFEYCLADFCALVEAYQAAHPNPSQEKE